MGTCRGWDREGLRRDIWVSFGTHVSGEDGQRTLSIPSTADKIRSE